MVQRVRPLLTARYPRFSRPQLGCDTRAIHRESLAAVRTAVEVYSIRLVVK